VHAAAALHVKAIPPHNIMATELAPPAIEQLPGKSPNDPRFKEMWGMQCIHAPAAWAAVHDSAVIVAVIDTGVDYKHEDLRDNMWCDAQGHHGYNFVNDNWDPMDQNNHGTHCAGTIGAVGDNNKGVVGVNWKVKIMAVRWLDAQGSGDITNAIKAIDFAVNNGAKVLSNSWFWTEDDPDLRAAIVRAQKKHVLFVSAAGNFAQMNSNNGGDNDKQNTYGRIPSAYSASLDNVIAVAAIDSHDQLAPFSEWGLKTVQIGAPGVGILSTVINNQYDGTFSGTSMATPHVAGAAALTMAKFNNKDYAEIRQLLMSHARNVAGLKGKCECEGILDLSFLNP
jgi:thermitase